MRLGSSLRRRRPGRGRGTDSNTGNRRSSAGMFRRIGLGVAAGLISLVGGYSFATHVTFPVAPLRTDLVTVPLLRGLALAEGEAALARLGMAMARVDSIHHPTEPAGVILGQSPLEGQLAVPDGEIRLTVSLGPERRPVPEVTRLGSERALVVLDATGFLVVVDSLESDEPRGTVLALDPPEGTDAALPSEVHMSVSLGPPTVEMPALLGLQQSEAEAILDSLGLVVTEVEEQFRFGLDQGAVVQQSPAPAEIVETGAEVRLVVGRRGRGG